MAKQPYPDTQKPWPDKDHPPKAPRPVGRYDSLMAEVRADHDVVRLQDRNAEKQKVQQMVDDDEAREARARLPATQWTQMAEAISFISATLGEPFAAAQGNALYWSVLALPRADWDSSYPVCVGIADRLTVTIFFGEFGCDQATATKLYAIAGWAAHRKHKVEFI